MRYWKICHPSCEWTTSMMRMISPWRALLASSMITTVGRRIHASSLQWRRLYTTAAARWTTTTSLLIIFSGLALASWLLRWNWHNIFEYHRSGIALILFHNLDLRIWFGWNLLYLSQSFVMLLHHVHDVQQMLVGFRILVKWGGGWGL